MPDDGIIYFNDGTPAGKGTGKGATFYEQVETAYRAISAACDDVGRKVSIGAVIMALTQLQFEKNGELTLDVIMRAQEGGPDDGGE